MKTKNAKKKLLGLVILELVFFVVLIGQFLGKKKECIPLQTSLSDWQSDYVTYDGTGWEIDSSQVNTNDGVDFIYGPYMELPKGDYTLQVRYQCDYDQTIQPFASEGKKYYLQYGSEIMSSAYDEGEYRFRAKEDVDNFEVVVKYNGYGYFRIDDISIVPNTNAEQRKLVLFLVITLLLDIALLTYPRWEHNRNTMILIIAIATLVSLPLMMEGMHKGHDMRFHMMRIEGITHTLMEGQFPVRLNAYWLDGYGYPTSIYYGDYLLYLPAVLHMAGFSLIGSYKMFVFLINLCSTCIAYLCFHKMFDDRKTAMVVTFIYISSTYRLADIYVRSAVGEYCALMFFPLVALAIYQIFTERENCKKNALYLSLGMTGVLTTHVLSTEMMVVILIIGSLLFAVCLIWENRKQLFGEKKDKAVEQKLIKRLGNVMRTYLAGAAETLLFSFWFVVPFVDYYRNEMVSINDVVSGEDVKRIQNSGAFIAQYFAFFQNAFGLGNTNTAIDDRMGMTPGAMLMIALGMAVILWYRKRADSRVKISVILSVLVLYAASNLFPWDHLAIVSKLGNAMVQIQFPWRYLAFSCILLTVLLGFVMEQSERIYQKSSIIIVISIVTTLMFVGDYCDNANVVNFFDGQEVTTYSIGNGEYLRIDYDKDLFEIDPKEALIETNINWLDGNWHIREGIYDFMVLEEKGLSKTFAVTAGPDGGIISLPLFHYRGYVAEDTVGNHFQTEDGDNFEMQVEIPADYSGEITVHWAEPWYWRASEIISLLSIIGLCGYIFYDKKNESCVKEKEKR